MHSIILISILLSLFSHTCYAGHILFIPEEASPSHIWSMMPYAQSLTLAGHHITFLDLNDKDKPSVKFPQDYDVIHVNFTSPPSSSNFMERMWRDQWRGYGMWESYLKVEEWFENSWSTCQEKYAEVLATKWDLVVIDVMDNNHGYVVVELLRQKGIPYVIILTSSMFYSQSVSRSLGRDPTSRMGMFPILPSYEYEPYDASKLSHRLGQASDHFWEWLFMTKRLPYHMNMYRQIIGKSFSFEHFFQEASFTLWDGIDEFGHPYAESNDIISTSSHCLQRESDDVLDDEVRKFIEDPDSKGTIYIAFGSVVKWNLAPDRLKNVLESALNKLNEFRILFISPPGSFEFQDHVKVIPWTNQHAVLTHNTTKVFLSHGGLKSLREGICSETPLVILPLFAEQAMNARLSVERGIALALNKQQLTSEQMGNALRRVSSFPSIHIIFLFSCGNGS